MSKFNLSKLVKGVQTTLVDNAPAILTGIGVGGMVTTIILAVRATPKALILIEEEKERQNNERWDEACADCPDDAYPEVEEITELKPIDVIKTCWKCYVPAAIVGCASVACIIGANSIHTKRHAALAAAYSLSETVLKEYQEKVVETIGEKKEQTVKDAIAKDKIEKDPVTSHEIVFTGKGGTLCYDVLSGRYFESDIDVIKKAANELNRRMRDEMYISLNEYYTEIDLDSIAIGEDLGWNIDKGYIDLYFSAQLAPGERPCIVINHNTLPKYGYTRLT